MNEKRKWKYCTSLDMLDKHIDYTSKQEKKYEDSSIILKPGNGLTYFELQFTLGDSTQVRQIYTYSSEVESSYSKSFTDTAILVTCREDHKSYNLIRQCFKGVLGIEFLNKQELIKHLQRLANDQECQKYWRLPNGLVIDNSQCSRYNKESKKLKSKTTSSTLLFNQKSSFFMRDSSASSSTLQPNYAVIDQRRSEFNDTNDVSLSQNGNFIAFLPLFFVIGLFVVIVHIIYKLKNKADLKRSRQQTLQEVNVENSLELQHIIN